MIEALHANGMIGGDDFVKEIDSIRERADALRAKITGSDSEVVEEQLGGDAPYPATAEADPVGA